MVRVDRLTKKEYEDYQEKVEKIKVLYEAIPFGSKRKTIKELAVLVQRRSGTLKNWWFAGDWEIPNEQVDTVLKFFKKPKE